MIRLKKTIFALLAVGITASVVGFSACSDEPAPDKGCGVYGKYVNYVLNSDGNSYTIEMFNSSIIQSFGKYEDFEKEYDDLMAKTDELVIPATYNGKEVTGVGNYAFASCSFTKVVLPDTIKTIGFNAFTDCDNLNSVVVGSSVSSIGFGAFNDCYKLVEVYNRSSLSIQKGATTHGSIAQYAMDVYTSDYDSKLISDQNGFVTYTSGEDKILVNYYGGIFNPVLPQGITEINAYAFAGYRVSPDYLLGIDARIEGVRPIKFKRFRMLGEIACGEPIFANEDHETYIDASADIKADFCLTAKGDSMTGARIFDGDVVFIKEQSIVENGQIAAVVIGEEVTLKRWYYYPNQKKLVLQAENPRYEPFVFIGEELNNIRCLGRAVSFMSNL